MVTSTGSFSGKHILLEVFSSSASSSFSPYAPSQKSTEMLPHIPQLSALSLQLLPPRCNELGSNAAAPRCRCTLKPPRWAPSISGVHTAGWRGVDGWVGGWAVERVCVCVRMRAGDPNFLQTPPRERTPITARAEFCTPASLAERDVGHGRIEWRREREEAGRRGGEGLKQLESYWQPSASQ